jgi:hypothetical protein
MKKMKQKKKSKSTKKKSKCTIIPKMSASRQSYIRRFRRNIIRRANQALRDELDHPDFRSFSQRSEGDQIRRKMTLDEDE